jgi:hypothetical protein
MDSTRPITEMQPDTRCKRAALTRSTQHEDNTIASSGLKAQGKSLIRPELTGSLLRIS